MRVVCFHPARDPVMCGDGPISIGSAPGDAVVLNGAGVEPGHLTIADDARGLVLQVRAGCQRIYVNARAVREQALLRFGDTITLGANKFLVTSDAAPPDVDSAPGLVATDEVVLRSVSGATSGQALHVDGELHMGAGSRHFADLPYACRVARVPGKLLFESGSNLPRINGWRRNRVALAPNDQIVLGEHRLVVEAPGLQYAQHLSSRPQPLPQPTEAPAVDPAPPTDIWWLIGAAVVIAAIISLFVYFRW